MSLIKAEYIWIDGTKPCAQLRSKTKIVKEGKDMPVWGFDGSSTNQAPGESSDCVLQPVLTVPDPVRGGSDKLVLCEVLNTDMSAHESNTRAATRQAAELHAHHEAWYGIEQEYTMFLGSRPLGFPEEGYPAPQGQYYCAVGADNIYGRDIAEAHMEACLEAGLDLSGINAEVMPGQWEFQIGPSGPVKVGDHIWLARWLLGRIAEEQGVSISYDAKPASGDWNGAGAHTNFSTKAMRENIDAAYKAINKLEKNHTLHIENYGPGIEKRLTGLHETCSFKEFRSGVSDRGASIRIPWQVAKDGKGYIEDRRPNANCDPYVVARLMLETVCG